MMLENEEIAVDVPEGFTVRDEHSANWIIRKVVEARTYGLRVKAWAAAELRRAQREEQFFLHRYGHQLENWARSQIAQQHDGRKSVSLPGGVVGFRRAPASLTVHDEKSLLRWCKANLVDAVRVHETVLRSIVAAHVRSTGELVAGIELTGGNERFFIGSKKNEGIEAPDAE